jgi:hypothetical protein
MADKKKLDIPKASYPNPTDDFMTMIQPEYGKSVARAIQAEWFKREGTSNARFYSNKREFINRRLYAKGKQSTRQYKKYGFNGDVSYLNLDFTPIPIIPKFRSWVINGMMERDYNIRAKSIDRESQNERAKYREAIEKDMLTKDFNKNVKQTFGMDISNTGVEDLPESQEELDIHTELKFKPSTEIAQELAISSIFEENQYDETTRYQIVSDLVDLGLAVGKNDFSVADGVKLHRVDPENFIYSYTEDPFFRDCFYFGEFKNELMSNLFKEYDNMSEDDMEKIRDISSTWGDYHGLDSYNSFQDDMDGKVAVLNFCYKAVRKKIWKEKSNKTGGRKALKRDDDFEVKGKGDRDFKKRVKKEEIWIEGKYVLGADVLLEWNVMENQMRSKSNSNRVQSPFVAVAPNMERGLFDSLVDRMIPFSDKIKMIDLKIQQTLQMTLPDGQFIDIDGLTEIDLGDGNKYTPTEAFDMFMQTGSIFGRSSTYGGDFNNGKVPIQEIRSSSASDKLASLERQYLFNIQMIKDVTGLTRLDGNQPDKDSLVGIQKMAAYNSNVATREILMGMKHITLGLAKLTSLRISDILKYSDRKEDFIQRIGAGSVRNLDYFKDLHLRDFAIYLDLEPDEEERARLEQDLQIEIKKGTLGVEDKIDILNISNIKYANEVLKIRKKKYIKEQQQRKMQEIEAQKQANIKSAQASAQADMNKRKAELGAETQLENIKHRNSMQKMIKEYELKNGIEVTKGEYSIPKTEMQVQSQLNRDKMKEDRKDDRVKKEATVQSKLAEQRLKESDAIDFEENDDILSQFEL